MSNSEMLFRTRPGYYSRADVEDARLSNRPLARFMETMGFAVQRFNRGRETMVFEVHPVENSFGLYDVIFHLAGKPEFAEAGILKGDLLTIEHFCRDYGSRPEFLHLLPRLSRHLIEKEYSPSFGR
ncbi:hypothetical protein G6L37_05020 [Agrobacterium rubi]|nr:hypothetical protein [Agrobacterium rubi]NTF24717.1 hypothetical protein [Agrobacterium rubi]